MNINSTLPLEKRVAVSRREFLNNSSLAAAGAAVAANFPFVLTSRAQASLPIQVGLVGCGGRGTSAVRDVLQPAEHVKVVALADLFQDRLEGCRNQLRTSGVEVTDRNCFVGFDAGQKLIALPEVNYVLLATPPHFRPMHLRAAVEAGKNAFIEKPVAVDAPGVRSVIESGELAAKQGLTIVAGTQRRHSRNYQDTIKRLQDGAIGELLAAQAYFNTGELWHRGRKPDWSEMEYQCRNWYYFTWLSGDHIVEQHIHNHDCINWLFRAHPVKASGNGGRQSRTDARFGHIYDHFAIEYEYPSGAKLFSYCRQVNGTANKTSDFVIGARGTSDLKTLIQVKGEKPWQFIEKVPEGKVQEHADAIAAIRAGKPLNEARQVAESTLTSIMGREAAYSGQVIAWDELLNSQRSLAPEKYGFDAPPPKGEIAVPGRYKFA